MTEIGAKVHLYPPDPILIVDDEVQMLHVFELTLKSEGLSNVLTQSDASLVPAMLAERPVSLVMLDLRMPGVQGHELLIQIREAYPAVPIIMITGESDLETAIRCMRLGARDYLSKPVEPRRLISSVTHALELGELRDEYRTFINKSTQDHLDHPEVFQGIIAESANMRSIFHYVETIAPSRKPVLVTGESGVGKELIARALHRASGVPGPFVSETVAGYDDTVFSDALFGHVAGAFTGASGPRKGLVQSAESGTLFLDEIGDLSAPSQVKLLRLLQEREFRAVGSDRPQRTTARFIFATNRDLKAMRDAGTFRGDLFYRLSTHFIEIPPLRQRPRDIVPLVRHFVAKAAAELGVDPPAIPHALIQLLNTHTFPGNVRELEAMIFDGVAKVRGRALSLALFEPHLAREGGAREAASPVNDGIADSTNLFAGLDSLPTLTEVQSQLIDDALRRADGNQGIAARLLGISRSALNKRLHNQESHDGDSIRALSE